MFNIKEIKQNILKILEIQELLYEQISEVKLILTNAQNDKDNYSNTKKINISESKQVTDEELEKLIRGKELIMEKQIEIVPNKTFMDID